MGALTRNPRADSEFAAAWTGLKAMRKVRGQECIPLEKSFGDWKAYGGPVLGHHMCCELRVRATDVGADLWWKFDVGYIAYHQSGNRFPEGHACT